jgi:hypothetical protein
MEPANQQEAMIMEMIKETALKTAAAEEEAVDAEIAALEKLDEDDFEVIRERRRKQLQAQAKKKQEYAAMGHGEYQEIGDQADFFKVMNGKSPRVMCHFYTPSNPHCPIVDEHFNLLAKKHPECRICKINAEKAPYLCEKLMVVVMPTIVLVMGGQVVHKIEGFDEMGGFENFSTDYFEWYLGNWKIIDHDGEMPENPLKAGQAFNGKKFSIERESKNNIRSSDFGREDGEEFYEED